MAYNIFRQVGKMKKGIFGVEILTETEPAMRKTNNPFVGRVKKITHYVNAILGVEYQNVVNNRLTRSGNEANYQSEAPKGKRHYNAFFYQSLNDESVFYLKIGIYKNTTCKSTYTVDGHEATQSELEAFPAIQIRQRAKATRRRIERNRTIPYRCTQNLQRAENHLRNENNLPTQLKRTDKTQSPIRNAWVGLSNVNTPKQ